MAEVAGGQGGSCGAMVPLHCPQPLIPQGQTQETQQSLGPILLQIVPAWEEVSLMLPRAGSTWPHSWLNSRSEAGLRLVHTRSPSQTPHPGPLDCGTTSQVHHTRTHIGRHTHLGKLIPMTSATHNYIFSPLCPSNIKKNLYINAVRPFLAALTGI